MTGWAQVHGRNLVTWDDRLSMDIWYVQNWSFWLDLSILFRTFLAVALRKNVSLRPDLAMQDLDEERANTARDGNQ
jgi:hypothetical protein